MSFGRVSEVQTNSGHGAYLLESIATNVEAYQPIDTLSGAAGDRRDLPFDFRLPLTHSVQFDPRHVSPFQAGLNALNLQWEVWFDNLYCLPQAFVPGKFHDAKESSVPNLSQRPHSCNVHTKHVRFDDQIDIFLGDDEEIAMSKIHVSQTVLQDWPTKPWSRKRIRKQKPIPRSHTCFPYSPDDLHSLEPYSYESMLSRDCTFPEEERQYDMSSFVQAFQFKQSMHSDQEVDLVATFGDGRTVPDTFMGQNEGSDHESFESEPPISRSSTDSHVHPPALDATRQDVILFHLGDLPLRVFLDWSNYENMIQEIAFHYATNVADVVDAYEINAEVHGLPPDTIPIIAHLFPDIAVGQRARLALFDLEFHAHHTEAGFRAGPMTQRFVLAAPEFCDRATVLVLVDADRYCISENDRCFVWHNNERWQDTDLVQRHLSHGDLIRIAIPPSERYACPTTQIVRWTQDRLSDDEIVGHIAEREVEDGYSPSLLDEEEVRALGVPRNRTDAPVEDDHDAFQAMQTNLPSPKPLVPNTNTSVGNDHDAPHDTQTQNAATGVSSIEVVSSDDELPEDWTMDLQRIVSQFERNCNADREVEFIFSIYTWFLDHDKHLLCREPKIVVLGGDPTEWKEDILQPWRFWLEPDQPTFIDLVQPMTPRARIEEHLAHVIITQRHADKSSVLLSMEFTDRTEPSVIIRTAVVLPKLCTPHDVILAVPTLSAFSRNPIVWEFPHLVNLDQSFKTWSGLGLKLQVKPSIEPLEDEVEGDSFGLMQVDICGSKSNSKVLPSLHLETPGDSFTDEFLQAVDAARQADELAPAPLDPLAIDAQPIAFRGIWDRISIQMAVSEPQTPEYYRVESWFLHHATYHRCHTSRITLLSADFTRWRSQLVATWRDRVLADDALTFALVSPEPEDAAAGTFAQLIITEGTRTELRSIVLSVYDSDEDSERNPYTFALVAPRRINLQRLVTTLHLQYDCPPANLRNLCSLWFGSIPIGSVHEVNVQDGNAFRLVISRGIAIDIPQLLTLDNSQIRSVLQRAIHIELFDRPPEPAFLSMPGNGDSTVPNITLTNATLQADARPVWLQILERHFQVHHEFDIDEEEPFLNIAVWYLNLDVDFHCDAPRMVRISTDPFMWRTDCIFPWRERLIRGTAAEIEVLPMLAHLGATGGQCPHVFVTQNIPNDQFAVLITVHGTDGLRLPLRQFAHVFLSRTPGRDIIRLAVPSEHLHRPTIIKMSGQTYFPDESLILRPGVSLSVLVSGAEIDIYTDQVADAFNLFQRNATLLSPQPHHCKPGHDVQADEFPMTFPDNHVRRPPRPYHDGSEQWIEDLAPLFQDAVDYNAWDDEVTIQVTVWYVHHTRRPACLRPRYVNLARNPLTWIDALRHAWGDLLDVGLPFAVHVVRPMPPQFRSFRSACHILLEQAPNELSAAVVLTTLFEGTARDGMIQGAFSISTRTNMADVIRAMDTAHYCAGHLCTLFANGRAIPEPEWIDVTTGSSLYLRVSAHDLVDEDAEELRQHFEDLALMQTSGFRFNPDAAAFQPGSGPIQAQPEHLQDLFVCWDNCAFAWEEESRAAHVLTWFVAPGRGQRRCLQSRRVTLFQDFSQWEAKMKARWRDVIDPTAPVSFVVVQPAPPHMEPSISAHVLLIQHELITMSSPLVTIYDSAINHGLPFRVVVTLNERANTAEIIEALGYTRDCHCPGTVCAFRFERMLLQPGSHIAVRDGHCISVSVSRTILPENWQPPIIPELPGTEGLSLLQSRTSLVRAQNGPKEVPTWFLHGRRQPHCSKPRFVPFDDNFSLAEVLRGVWFDVVDDAPLEILTIIHPVSAEVHYLGVQAFDASVEIATLIEASEINSNKKLSQARAAFLPSPSCRTDIGRVFGVDLNQASQSQLDCCDIIVDGQRDRQCSHGSFVQFAWTRHAVAKLPLEVDFTAVIRTFEELDAHFILPSYDLPPDFPWHPASWEWVQAPWWTPGLTCQELVLYYDGSCIKNEGDQSAGCAIAAFTKVAHVWHFAGAVSTKLDTEATSYVAELAAAILAHKFAFDLLKLMQCSQAYLPWVEFRFDSQTVGQQAEGLWQTWSQPRMGQFLRSLHRCLESKFGITLQHSHITAHAGEPGNELVDCLAFQAASGRPLHDYLPWLKRVTQAAFVDTADWVWYLFRQDMPWDGSCIVFPAGPSTIPDTSVFPSQLSHEEVPDSEQQGWLDIKFATCNILSLKPVRADQQTAAAQLDYGPSRQEALLTQFHEAGIHVWAWQETRFRQKSQWHDPNYWIFRSPANAQGHYGIFIGLHRKLPIGHITLNGRKEKVFVKERELAIIFTSPRLLILRVCNPLLKCVLIAGHAPHTGADLTTICAWWRSVTESIPIKYHKWPFVLLADANARVGAEPNDQVGDHQAEMLDPKAEGFLDFLARHGLWIPATFAATHVGLGATWRHSRGQWYRNDYVCIPHEWQLSHCLSWVSDDIDVGLLKEDHRAAVVHLTCAIRPFGHSRRASSTKLQLEGFDPACLQDIPSPAWSVDVHSHAAALQDALVDRLWPYQTRSALKPKRTTMTEGTWHLVLEKRSCRNRLHEQSRIQKLTLLQAWFSCWKHAMVDCSPTPVHAAFDDLLRQQDQLIALSYWQFRCLGLQVAKALRADDIQFYSSLLADCTEFLHPGAVKQLWGVVRRSLPKHQQRRMNTAPFQLEALEDQWLPHYERLEAGVATTPEGLIEDCIFQQALRRLDAPLHLNLLDLPCLSHLETAFRSVPPGKASGYDPLPSALFHQAPAQLAQLHHDLVMKEFLWQSEPIQAKGGPVAILPKVLHPTTASQFRGILLLPNAGKRAHAILRSRIMQSLAPVRSPGQLGGFPGQQVLYGSHAIRTFGTICDSHGLSSAILFLDLSSAFHHLIREAVVGSVDGANLEPVMRVLSRDGHSVDKYHAFEQLSGILADIGVAMPIVRLLRDIHLSTWCTLHDRWLLHTHRGTRPGSPLADIIFHALMARVTSAVDQWLRAQDGFMRLLSGLDIEAPTVVWADDIAVPLASYAAEDVVPFLLKTLEHVRLTLRDYGITLNFAKGKTSAVLTLKGQGASALRKKYLLNSRPGVMCTFDDGSSEWLHFTPAYRHLGTQFTSSHDLTCELRARAGMAKSSFAQLAKPILTNKNLPTNLRLQFFHSLVMTKFFFGLGSWPTPTPKQLQYLQGVFAALLKRVLRVGQLHLPADQMFAIANMPETRVKLAVERLLYAQRLFRTGPAFLHNMLHREFACVEGSWLHGLRADLVWMEEVCPGCLPEGWKQDLTPLFDLWQNPRSTWMSTVKRCLKVHLIQNAIMSDAKKLHGAVFRTLKSAGASFEHGDDELGLFEDLEVCFCGQTFQTRRGLLAHQRKAHHLFSPERPFLQGCTCLHCGKYLWSTQRLQQHLAYIPKRLGYNPCFAALTAQGRVVEYAKEDVGASAAFAGLSRRDALQVEGPSANPLTLDERRYASLNAELERCHEQLQIPCAPADEVRVGESLGEALEAATLSWFRAHYPHGPNDAEKNELTDGWVEALYACPGAFEANLDPWLERVFLLWGEHWLPDIIATFEDGVAEYHVEEIFADFASQLERYQILARIAHLEAGIRSCVPTPPIPHRARHVTHDLVKHPKVCSRAQQTVLRAFAGQSLWLRQIRRMSFLDFPPEQSTPKLVMADGQEVYLVLHLFSGRRRAGDVHAHLLALAADRGIAVLVLSVDTAVLMEFGNLALGSTSWKAIIRLYEAGVVAATLVGSPCETFSEARFHVDSREEGGRSGPRPLRSADCLLGLEGLTPRELRQCHMGGNFFQQAAWTLGFHMAFGGCYISEHPARPHDASRPSIWTSPLLEVLQQHPDVRLAHVCQYLWGATVVKPTGLLHFQLPHFCRDLYTQADVHAPRPQAVAIGRDDQGVFRTAQHKEYPQQFCKGLAYALVQKLARCESHRAFRVAKSLPDDLMHWLQGAAKSCAVQHRGTWLPDFQVIP